MKKIRNLVSILEEVFALILETDDAPNEEIAKGLRPSMASLLRRNRIAVESLMVFLNAQGEKFQATGKHETGFDIFPGEGS